MTSIIPEYRNYSELSEAIDSLTDMVNFELFSGDFDSKKFNEYFEKFKVLRDTFEDPLREHKTLPKEIDEHKAFTDSLGLNDKIKYEVYLRKRLGDDISLPNDWYRPCKTEVENITYKILRSISYQIEKTMETSDHVDFNDFCVNMRDLKASGVMHNLVGHSIDQSGLMEILIKDNYHGGHSLFYFKEAPTKERAKELENNTCEGH